MYLTTEQETNLRKRMVASFDLATLTLFLHDWLSVDVETVTAVQGLSFEVQCHQVIRWAKQTGELVRFLEAIKTRHTNEDFKAFVAQLVPAPAAGEPVAGVPKRSYLVSRRPVLDRTTLWRQLTALANEKESNRVLIVNGGVGKSYSLWPVSHICHAAWNVPVMACVEVNVGNVVNVDGTRLASLIATRLWGSPSLGDIDDLAQAPRLTKDTGGLIVQRLAALEKRTWLILDELDRVNLDESAIELLCRICKAVDAVECPNVWLFLFGLDPARLDPRVARFLLVDVVQRPSRQDILDYLVWFAGTIGRPLQEPALAPTVDELDALLPAEPDYSSWYRFHEKLAQRCGSIEQGTLP